MHAYLSYHPAPQPARRFSGVLQPWFPIIHQKTFPGTLGIGEIPSAAQTADHL